MTEANNPLVVDFLLADARITAIVNLVDDRRRLVDILNMEEPMLEAATAHVQLVSGAGVPVLQSISIAKSAILAAVPRETAQQAHRRAIQRTVVGRNETLFGQFALILPTILVEGTAHARVSSGRLKADPGMFAHFFSVTEAHISLPNHESLDVPVAVINRDAVLAMSMLPSSASRLTNPGSWLSGAA